jgi:hypothetical protein
LLPSFCAKALCDNNSSSSVNMLHLVVNVFIFFSILVCLIIYTIVVFQIVESGTTSTPNRLISLVLLFLFSLKS